MDTQTIITITKTPTHSCASFKDGGVTIFTTPPNADNNSSIFTPIPTPQTEAFLAHLQTIDKNAIEALIKNHSKAVVSKESFVNINPYEWGKAYTLNNGGFVFVDDTKLRYFASEKDCSLNEEVTHHSEPIFTLDIEPPLLINKELIANTFEKEGGVRLSDEALERLCLCGVRQAVKDGRLINPFNLRPEDLKLSALATSLSRICRFAGQTKVNYSVAHHIISMANLDEVQNDPVKKLHVVLHELYEAVTGIDMITPYKYSTSTNEYRLAEQRAEEVFKNIFGMEQFMPAEIKLIDNRMCATEGIHLMDHNPHVRWDAKCEPYSFQVFKPAIALSQEKACDVLMQLFCECGVQEKLDAYIEARAEFMAQKAKPTSTQRVHP